MPQNSLKFNNNSPATDMDEAEEPLEDPVPLRPLTSLKWPYVPEESAFPDPLKRDDPKPLQLPQYEDRKSTRLNSSHSGESRMPSSA